MKELLEIVRNEAAIFKIESRAIMAFISAETGGKGFDDETGKIIIQFEPSWYRKRAPYAPSGAWSLNKVDVQKKEWLAFNDAFCKNKVAAMEATSIGIGQIMGFHWKRLGYESVHAMWDDAKKGIERQIWQICKFIATDIKLQSCLRAHDWDGVATLYNGAAYKEMAKKWGREPYDITLANAYEKYKRL
jgi:hypothetical protein